MLATSVSPAAPVSDCPPYIDRHPVWPSMRRPLIALVCDDRESQSALRLSLDQLGYASVAYECIEELANALKLGWCADLVLLSSSGMEQAARLLATLRPALTGPAILIAPFEKAGSGGQVRQLLQEETQLDFIVAPATMWEIECRVHALLLRASRTVDQPSDSHIPPKDWRFDQFHFLVRENTVLVYDREVRLKAREFELAQILFRRPDQLVPRDWIWSKLWGRVPAGNSRSLDVCAAGVRKKLDLHEESGFILSAVYGKGYRLSRIIPRSFRTPELCEPNSRPAAGFFP